MARPDPVRALWLDRVATPLGPLTVVATDRALCALAFGPLRPPLLAGLRARFPGAALRRRRDPGGHAGRLRAYFAGDLRALDGIAVAAGGTAFERLVWDAVRAIPPGATRTYGELARLIGRPRAVRAVGRANGRNPVCLVIPCHRVVGSDGRLRGYGGGLGRKRWLLAHEGVRVAGPPAAYRLADVTDPGH